MMYLKQGSPNTVVLTLTEKAKLPQPHFLFVLRETESGKIFTFIAADSSDAPERYNQFVITEKAQPDPLQGELQLPAGGTYRYEVMEQDNALNLNPSLAGRILETGLCMVEGSPAAPIAYEKENNTQIIYNG